MTHIVDFVGGLGNQLFQYAFYLNVKKAYKSENVAVYTGRYKKVVDNKGFQLANYFNIKFKFSSDCDVKKITRGDGTFGRVVNKLLGHKTTYYIENNGGELYDFKKNIDLNDRLDCFYRGLWQEFNYCDLVADELRINLTFNRTLLKEHNYSFENVVSLHVRRGDYYSNKEYESILGGVCDISYYQRALKYFTTNFGNSIKLLVFSDDVDWVKENMPFLNDYEALYSDSNSDIQDLYLMSQCEHNIICNSTFSWWGAWLNANSSKIVVMPEFWFKNVPSDSYCVPGWVRV